MASSQESSAQSHSPEIPPLKDRISALYEQLVVSAEQLNSASDELAEPITTVDRALKNLNLGIETWIDVFRENDAEYDRFLDRQIGYAKSSGDWGLAIRTRQGFYDDYTTEQWRFSEAPRAYRLEAIDKLPDLLEQLLATATDTAEKLRQKVQATKEIAEAVARPFDLRRRLLDEIRIQDQVFYDNVVRQARKVALDGGRMSFIFSPEHKELREAFEQKKSWLSALLTKLGRSTMTVASAYDKAPSQK